VGWVFGPQIVCVPPLVSRIAATPFAWVELLRASPKLGRRAGEGLLSARVFPPRLDRMGVRGVLYRSPSHPFFKGGRRPM